MQLAEDDKLRTAKGTYLLGCVYADTEPERGNDLFLKAITHLNKNNSPEASGIKARAWYNYATNLALSNQSEESLDIIIRKAIPYAKAAGDKKSEAFYTIAIATYFYNQHDFHTARQYLNKSIILYKEASYKGKDVLEPYLLLTSIYLFQKNITDAKKTLDTATLIFKQFPNSSLNQLYYLTYSRYYRACFKYYEALTMADQGLKNIDKGSETYYHSYNYYDLKYEIYFSLKGLKRFKEAKNMLDTLKQAIVFAENNRIPLLLESASLSYYLHNYRLSHDLWMQFAAANDSAQHEALASKIATLETRFKTREKDLQINMLNSKNKVQQVRFWSIICLSAITIFFLFIMFYLRKKKQEKELQLIKQQKDMEFSLALMEGEEQERKRLARELHDGLGGTLTGIKLKLEQNNRYENSNLENIIFQLDSAVKDLRDTARNLMPDSLIKFGLNKAIDDFCKNIQAFKGQISYCGINLEKIRDKNIELTIYRIVQELVTNAVKHACASSILVQCSCDSNILLIDVEDDGIGFNQWEIKKNMGLDNIASRVNFLRGILHIDSEINKGTTISIECSI